MYIKSFNVPKKLLLFISSLLFFVMILPACDSDDTSISSSSGESIGKFGMILVGPRDDKGWSQAHFEGGQHIVDSIGAEMIVADLINPADSPNTVTLFESPPKFSIFFFIHRRAMIESSVP